jgi:hypothetical protein
MGETPSHLRNTYSLSFPHARMGETHGQHRRNHPSRPVKCVWEGSPWEPMSPKRLPADTASGQGQAFRVSSSNTGDRPQIIQQTDPAVTLIR